MKISWLDVRLGLRMLVKHPALSIVAGLGIAVSVALSAGFFSFMRAYIYPDLPLEEGDRIVAIENREYGPGLGGGSGSDENRQALHDFVTWKEELRTVADVGAFRHVLRNVSIDAASPEAVQVAEMTASGFRLARVAPLLGRYLIDEDEEAAGPHVIVIGFEVWQSRFAGDPDIIGRELRVAGVPHEIVGVMPEGFGFPESDQYWLPFRADPARVARGEGPSIFVFGRLAPGVTMQQAQAELAAVGRSAAEAWPETNANIRPMVMRYTHSLTDVQGISLWEVMQMQLMMTLLLLIVAVNVAILVYARTASRNREIAVRSALGASRSRIIAQLFAEAMVLALAASAAGLAIAQVGIDLGAGILNSEMSSGRAPFWLDLGLRWDTILFTVGLAVLTATIVGIIPGIRATRGGLQQQLRQLGGPTVGLGRTWTALIIAQVAIAVAALPVAIATGWVEIERGASRATYPAEEFIVAGIAPDPEAREDAAAFGLKLDELLRRLRSEPAVAGVTFRGTLPDRGSRVLVEDAPRPANASAGHRVTPVGVAVDLFDVFGKRVLAGRSFTAADVEENATAVIVNDAFVQQVLAGGDALGRRIRFVSPEEESGDAAAASQWLEIVGITENMVENPANPLRVTPTVAYAVAADRLSSATLIVRMRQGVGPAELTPRVREHAMAVDPTLRVGQMRSLSDSDRQQQQVTKLIALGVALVLVSVLLLSSAGIYALLSFTVTQRRREIGIRAALGAGPRQVLRSVFSRAALQVGAGVLFGATAVSLANVASQGEVLGERGLFILPALALTMVLVGLAAALGPARRGLSIEPTEALRSDG